MIKEKALKHGIKLLPQLDGVPETIIADERKLKQIMYNLLSNAVKFTPDGGSISIVAASNVYCLLSDQINLFDSKKLVLRKSRSRPVSI